MNVMAVTCLLQKQLHFTKPKVGIRTRHLIVSVPEI